MSNLILFWHRRDLRITDNIGLSEARKRTPKIIGIFCLDPNILQRDDIAPARVKYMLGCLENLQQNYQKTGSQLLILKNDPKQAIPTLANALKAKAVFWNWDIEPYAQQRDQTIKQILQQTGIEVQNFWDQLLHSPDQIRTGTGQKYTVYTPFWRNWNSKPKSHPTPTLENTENLTETEQETAKNAGATSLPTLKELGFTWDNPLILQPGETPAKLKLDEFCSQAIFDYDTNRNYPAIEGTSTLSAALKFGAIGIRTVWQATETLKLKCQTEEQQAGIQTWQQEIAWREFYQHALYNFPELAEGPYRNPLKNFPWEGNQTHFQAWCEGKTGYPIIDAAMRQMNQTAWMHNRCRMIVASFLTKDLILNWQLGEKYFMQKLYDGDLSANNGGWQWSASSGMDPKPLRIFNPATQAQKFDPKAEYIRQWVPELAGINTKDLLTGNITPLERKACGYPAPIVDHNRQQRRFKELFQQQKAEI